MKTRENFLSFTKANNNSNDYLKNSVNKLNKVIHEYIQNIEGMKKGIEKCIERLRGTEKELITSKRNIEICTEKINEAFNADKVDLYVTYVKNKEILEEDLTELEKRYNIEKTAVEKLQSHRLVLLKKSSEIMHIKSNLESKFNATKSGNDVKTFISSLQTSESSNNSRKKSYKLVKDIAFE